MLRPSVLVLALVLSSRAWWLALQGQSSLLTALIWFLVAVPVAGLMLAAVRSLAASYRKTQRPAPAKNHDA